MADDQSLVLLTDVNRMLAEVKTIPDAVHLMNLADAARVYAQKMRLGREAQNHAAEITLRTERLLGRMLAAELPHQVAGRLKTVEQNDRLLP